MRNLQWRARMAGMGAWLSGTKRLGIVARLSISFIAVATLAVAGNFLAGRSYIMHTTTRVETPAAPRPSPAPIALPAPAPAAAPAANAPAPRSTTAALEYSRTLQQFGAALWERATGGDAAADAALHDTGARLARAASRLSGDVGAVNRDLARAVLGKNREVEDRARTLIALVDERHRVLDEYRRHLEQLNQSTKSALDGSFKIFGRFIAREYLLKLDQSLQKVRAQLEDAIASDAAPASLLTLEASEREYGSVLDANRASLERVQGPAWLQSTRDELSVLAGFRESLQHSHDLYGEQRATLTKLLADAAAISDQCVVSMQSAPSSTAALVRPSPPLIHPTPPPVAAPLATEALVPAPAPATAETTTITPQDEGRYTLLVEITIAVVVVVFLISLFTALSIVRPVRRLVHAAAKLAAGETHIRVERGGMKELDQLAGSFNQMAQDLEVAGEASRSYQARLEADVEARTRELRELAESDPLTQLPNRRHGLKLLEESLAAARSGERYMGVCFLDLDNFKSINDSLGHAFGDQVLTRVAERLIEVSASFGVAVRLGGDEFCIIHHEAESFDDIHRTGAQLVQAFRTPLQIEQRELIVSVSCGLSVYPLHGATCAELLSSADAALYRAKSMGRNQTSIYTADLLESAAERFSVEQRLRRSIERGELQLVFQPEVAVDSLRLGLVEALLRWRQADGRLASPAEFLGVAESSGFIGEIDKWVVSAALEAAAKWHHGDWPEARVAINVSSRQLLDPHFVGRLKELLLQHRLPPGCIEIELTETVLQTGAATVKTLHELKAEGFAIALDDFGTGYSSLTSLAQLPLSRVKLDRSLIAGHDSDERSAAIARTTMMLCEHLQLQVTAEGIETAGQLEWLLDHDSVFLQGYLISRPLPFDEIAPSLEAIHQKMALHVLSRNAVPAAAGVELDATRDARAPMLAAAVDSSARS